MGGVALLARSLGMKVSGSDANVYPPMSEQLEAAGIELQEGYLAAHMNPKPDFSGDGQRFVPRQPGGGICIK